jgi:hypothetical protein
MSRGFPGLMRGRLAILTLCLALAGLLPAAAEARPRLQPLVDEAPATSYFKDVVVRGGSSSPTRALARSSAVSGAFKAYPTKEGYSVGVAISDRYAAPFDGVAQGYVDFLDQLPHASELHKLSVYVAPPDEVLSLCGGEEGTLACYLANPQTMIVPGEQTDTGYGVTSSYVITHEYGHHIANNRSNAPFNAFAFGPKYWASYELVCDRAIKKQLYPGDEGEFYAQNPGESWAETYARLQYPDQPWTFSELLKPDQGALDAAAKDVGDLWPGQQVRTFQGRFTKRSAKTRTYRFDLTLDGAMSLRLRGPRAANYDFTVVSDGGGRGTTNAAGSRDSISYESVCRSLQRERVTVTVKRVKGYGPFSLRVSYPG